MSCRILYISGSLGLGHVTRDLAVASEIRRIFPGAEIEWIASPPASDVLEASGERLAPEQAGYRGETALAEGVAKGGRLNLTTYVFKALAAWIHNARLIGKTASRGAYDVIVGNETYEIPVSNFLGIKVLPPIPFVMMYDFWGLESMSGNYFEKLGTWLLNFVWSQEWRVTARYGNAALFFGEKEDVPDRSFGLMLPNRRRSSERHIEFVGYPLPFDPLKLPEREALRRELGYGDGPLVICSVGGTAIGKELLELCGRSYPIVADRIPGLRMVLVAGPRIDPQSLVVPPGVVCRGMVPRLWRHLAACDLAVLQGGGTTTLEAEALRVPFLFFPVENHSEQEITVAGRLARHKAGIRMGLSTTGPLELAQAILSNLGVVPSNLHIPTDGVRLAARRILERAGIQEN